MRVLGAILAGGQSRRFGSDKASALLDGKSLLDHVADALRAQTEALVVAGRAWPGIESVADLPSPGLGPLAGLAGALDYAWRHDFDAVLSSGCDVIGVPGNLAEQLGTAPSIATDLPIVGLWPVALRTSLLEWLEDPENRSVYAFAAHIGVSKVDLAVPLRNVNRPEDLA